MARIPPSTLWLRAALYPKPETLNPMPETPNLKPETPKDSPKSLNPKPLSHNVPELDQSWNGVRQAGELIELLVIARAVSSFRASGLRCGLGFRV